MKERIKRMIFYGFPALFCAVAITLMSAGCDQLKQNKDDIHALLIKMMNGGETTDEATK